MKIVSGVFGVIILALVVAFALSNRQDVTVVWGPFGDPMTAPLYTVGLMPLVFGLVFGGLWGWLCSMPHRMRARRLKKELTSMNEKIGELQKNTVAKEAKANAKSGFWRFK